MRKQNNSELPIVFVILTLSINSLLNFAIIEFVQLVSKKIHETRGTIRKMLSGTNLRKSNSTQLLDSARVSTKLTITIGFKILLF